MAMLRGLLTRKFNTSAILRSAEDAHHKNAEQAEKLWKNLTYFVAFPAIGLCMVNTYISHTSHHPERPPYVPYEYMRIRIRKYPWGDGNRTLFHNPHVNALPDGYED